MPSPEDLLDAAVAVPPAPSRSPKAVRVLLLGACAAGLVGLAVPGTSPAVSALSVTPTATTTLLAEPPVPHVPSFAVAPRAKRVVASRSRAVPAKKAAPKAAPRAAKKKSPAKKKTVSTGWVRPSYAGVVSPYGMRWGRMHKGIDFGASYGAPIRAVGAGTVIGAGYLASESGYGQITLIRHANGVVSAYAHQSSVLVHAGDHVDKGETIGYVGSTGHSTGPHLHFEIRMSTHGGQVNPLTWLREHGVSI